MHALANLALRAARAAAEILTREYERLDRIKLLHEGANGPVTSAAQQADAEVRYQIGKLYPEHPLRSVFAPAEEGSSDAANTNTEWLLEPIVGAANFAAGLSRFALALCCRSDKLIQHAVVINPLLREEFVASRGSGAQLNGRRIRSDRHGIEQKHRLLGLDSESLPESQLHVLQPRLREAGFAVRSSGCLALDLTDTACGRLHGGWCAGGEQPGLRAASLILREAGGMIGDQAGGPDLDSASELFFGEPATFKQLVKLRRQP